jgi:hypothetical protein
MLPVNMFAAQRNKLPECGIWHVRIPCGRRLPTPSPNGEGLIEAADVTVELDEQGLDAR